MHIVIADPDAKASDLLAYAATRRGHHAIAMDDAGRLLDPLPLPPAVAVVAIDDFGPDDFAVVRRLRERYPGVVVLATTERRGRVTSMEALEAGVHDVVQEPYHPRELILRAESWVESRGTEAPTSRAVTLADLTIDLDRYSAMKNNVELTLTRLELRLLYCLCEHHPHVAAIERLLAFGWDEDEEPDPSLLKTHMSHIRSKLRNAGGIDLEIRSRQMIGYAIHLAEAKEAVGAV